MNLISIKLITISLVLFIILSRSPVLAIFSSILVYILTSFILIGLGIEFLAIVLIIIYVGAISVSFSFVIMMLNLRLLETINLTNEQIFIFLFFIIFFLMICTLAMVSEFFNPTLYNIEDIIYIKSLTTISYIQYELDINNIGQLLINHQASFVIIAAVTSPLAMISSITLTRIVPSLALNHHFNI